MCSTDVPTYVSTNSMHGIMEDRTLMLEKQCVVMVEEQCTVMVEEQCTVHDGGGTVHVL